MADVEVRPLRIDARGGAELSEIAALAVDEGWPTFSDRALLRRLVAAPGTLTLVAVAATPRPRVVGFAHALTNGHHAYLSVMAVDRSLRRQGIGRRLVDTFFELSGVERMDLLSASESQAFYDRLPRRELAGYRVFPREPIDST